MDSKWLVGFAAAQTVAFGVAYIRLLLDNAFIKGQLSQVMQGLGAVAKTAEAVAVLDRSHTKTQTDLGHAFQKIRHLEKGASNGSHHEPSEA